MNAGHTVTQLLTNQLRLWQPLPEDLLRAAARMLADQEHVAALLAARLDLPDDVREQIADDRRPSVRIAYCARDDLDTSELRDLIGTENRAAVLAGIAEKTRDPIVEHLLWERFAAKPTRTLAVALLRSLTAEATRPLAGQERSAAAPPALVDLVFATLGPQPNVTHREHHKFNEFGNYLATGANPATAEALAVNPNTTDRVRIAAAMSSHLSANARIAALRGMWEDRLISEVKSIVDRGGQFEQRTWYLPSGIDLLAEMLDRGNGLQPEVIAYARGALDRVAAAGVPASWTSQWLAMLDGHTHQPCEANCEDCATRAAAPTEWAPALDQLPNRDPNRDMHGPGQGHTDDDVPDTSSDTTSDAEGTEGSEADPDVAGEDVAEVDARARLAAMHDYDIAGLLRDEGTAEEVEAAVEIGRDRESTVVISSAMARPEVDERDAVSYLSFDWFRPADEVLVRLVGARPGQRAFALAAAGRTLNSVVGAFGTAIFAAPGAMDPTTAGAEVVARQVFDALAGKAGPGWEKWSLENSSPNSPLNDLDAFITHPGVADGALLLLPWTLVVREVGATAMSSRLRWDSEARTRLTTLLVSATTAAFGASTAEWEAYARLGDNFAGSVADLLEVSKACVTD